MWSQHREVLAIFILNLYGSFFLNPYSILTVTMKSFKEKVLAVVIKIPKGKVLTYGEVAQRAGNEKASRAVGSIMAKNIDKSVPCHRVVKSDGGIGMYNGLQGKSKLFILQKEGVKFSKKEKVLF